MSLPARMFYRCLGSRRGIKGHGKNHEKDAIVFAMANPVPEIMYEEAKEAGARVMATGRSDCPNQINNVLVFPGLFRGALDCRARDITCGMKLAAAYGIAGLVSGERTGGGVYHSFCF